MGRIFLFPREHKLVTGPHRAGEKYQPRDVDQNV